MYDTLCSAQLLSYCAVQPSTIIVTYFTKTNSYVNLCGKSGMVFTTSSVVLGTSLKLGCLYYTIWEKIRKAIHTRDENLH